MPDITTSWSGGNASIRLDMRELQKIIDKMPERVETLIKKVAFRAEGYMKQRAAVDTGAMVNSIYTKTQKYDGFPSAQAAALAKDPRAHLIQHPEPPEFTAYVGPSVDYAIYQEFGTYRMAAHPFVTPGVTLAAQDLFKLAPELFE